MIADRKAGCGWDQVRSVTLAVVCLLDTAVVCSSCATAV